MHWNFFLTLALLPIFEVLTHRMILRMPVALLGLWIGVREYCIRLFGILGLYIFLLSAAMPTVVRWTPGFPTQCAPQQYYLRK